MSLAALAALPREYLVLLDQLNAKILEEKPDDIPRFCARFFREIVSFHTF
jgi:hypothetical protein